ncbi:hypothetical protein [Sphingomonas bacterium]|uniref:hypothetical protein n=1 Tax=Sphingomonas bacterium TaxID=1895847 RepID=UPI00261B59AB|nr:hypothetical protein [Sphingomonas bacterium]MDB5678368.1 hypothetical protein [Sphingomonas bacterium]
MVTVSGSESGAETVGFGRGVTRRGKTPGAGADGPTGGITATGAGEGDGTGSILSAVSPGDATGFGRSDGKTSDAAITPIATAPSSPAAATIHRRA